MSNAYNVQHDTPTHLDLDYDFPYAVKYLVLHVLNHVHTADALPVAAASLSTSFEAAVHAMWGP